MTETSEVPAIDHISLPVVRISKVYHYLRGCFSKASLLVDEDIHNYRHKPPGKILQEKETSPFATDTVTDQLKRLSNRVNDYQLLPGPSCQELGFLEEFRTGFTIPVSSLQQWWEVCSKICSIQATNLQTKKNRENSD